MQTADDVEHRVDVSLPARVTPVDRARGVTGRRHRRQSVAEGGRHECPFCLTRLPAPSAKPAVAVGGVPVIRRACPVVDRMPRSGIISLHRQMLLAPA